MPGLYGDEEEAALCESLKATFTDAHAGRPPADPEALLAFFVGRVRANLHVVLCMSPAHPRTRLRLRMYPVLAACCTIDWFSKSAQRGELGRMDG